MSKGRIRQDREISPNLSQAEHTLLRRLLHHLIAAHRLQRPEALESPDTEPVAGGIPASRASASRAVKGIPNHWTLVVEPDCDGRRYLLALENPPGDRDLGTLSPRERQVVDHAARGLDNKVIAYELGLKHSTIKVLMARAARKVGVRTRADLLRAVSVAPRA